MADPIQITQVITELPASPTEGSGFRTRCMAFFAGMIQMVTQLELFRTQANAVAVEVNGHAVTCASNASWAQSSAADAVAALAGINNQADIASAAADLATTAANDAVTAVTAAGAAKTGAMAARDEAVAAAAGVNLPAVAASNAGQFLGVSEAGAYALLDPSLGLPAVTAGDAGAGLIVSPLGEWGLGPVFGLSAANEVAIGSATTLDASALGRMRVCSGTSVDYAVTLPTAVGNAGKLLGIRIAGACTKLVTLTANGSELIDGAATRVMWAGESAVLLSDGVGWSKILGHSIPMVGRISAASSQSIPSGSYTAVALTSADINAALMCDTTNNRLAIRRAGIYNVNARLTFSNSIIYTYQLTGAISSTGATQANNGYSPSVVEKALCASGSTLSLIVYQSTGSSQSLYSAVPAYVAAEEVPQW